MNITELIEFVTPYLTQYGPLISFLGGLFAGEEVIIALSFLSASGLIPLWVVFVFCFAGILVCDSFFFIVGKLKFFSNFKRFEKLVHISKKIEKIILKLTKKSTLQILLYSKFIFGTRIATILYLSSKKTPYREFILNSFIVGILWMAIVVSIGWFAGDSFNFISEQFKNIQLAILFVVVFMILVVIIKKIIEKKILQSRNLK